jgi:flagellar M-ring protein FliF
MGVGKFLVIAGLIWYLVFKILMPILRQLATPPPPPPMPEMPVGGMAPTRATMEYKDNLQAARQIAQQDPKIVANVVKEWVGGE